MYCPECKHTVLVEATGLVHCGLCKVRFDRNVQLLDDPGAGDVTRDIIVPWTPEA
jgi:uncharacterized Zn finger protein (UPF0148 family)